jgi:RimJ/RimL family protein N-acetyltransferase
MQNLLDRSSVARTAPREASQSRTIRDFIATQIDRFARNGLVVYVDTDMADWVVHMERAPGITAVNSVFDPAKSTLTPDTCFWLRLEDEGRVVGCVCMRLFVTDDHIRDDYETQRVWGDKHPPERPVDILFPRELTFGGQVVQEGGAWVDPEYRGRDLAGRMLRLARAVALREWGTDVFTGTCLDNLFDKGVSRTHYGCPHDALLLDGWCLPMRQVRRMHLVWITRAEVIDQIAAEMTSEYARA